ncbi:uncharacterized protein LOC127715405 [Mytilus californianus]|uniref:uncharacterized protein LOC127715405 n=1 Tax=Mytilus californianus TaxID=6549 RepID=UPI002245DFBF|nr:uncharacterized protein LOC127715405 [Mytilus californianus]
MNVAKTMFLIIVVEVSCLILTAYCDDRQNGICTNNTRRVCCAHFELKDQTCTKCKKGYYNLKINSTCKPCTRGKYDTKCTKTCSCNSNERCHHVTGCILDHLTTTENKDESNMNYKGTDTKSDNGNGNVAIYMTCVAVASILVVVSSLIVKNRKIICRQKSRNNSLTTNIKKIKQPTFRFGRNKKVAESLYDEINEKYMINFDGE